MTKILIDEAVVRQAQQVPLHELLAKVPADARLVIEDADGFGTSFIPVGRYCQEAATVIRQALADAALDKMAENARELGLSYEQPAQPPVFAELHCVCGCEWEWRNRTWELVQTPPAQEPDPDELTIAYMSGLHEGKKRKPWVGLTNEEFIELCSADMGTAALIRAVEAKLKEKNTKGGAA